MLCCVQRGVVSYAESLETNQFTIEVVTAGPFVSMSAEGSENLPKGMPPVGCSSNGGIPYEVRMLDIGSDKSWKRHCEVMEFSRTKMAFKKKMDHLIKQHSYRNTREALKELLREKSGDNGEVQISVVKKEINEELDNLIRTCTYDRAKEAVEELLLDKVKNGLPNGENYPTDMEDELDDLSMGSRSFKSDAIETENLEPEKEEDGSEDSGETTVPDPYRYRLTRKQALLLWLPGEKRKEVEKRISIDAYNDYVKYAKMYGPGANEALYIVYNGVRCDYQRAIDHEIGYSYFKREILEFATEIMIECVKLGDCL